MSQTSILIIMVSKTLDKFFLSMEKLKDLLLCLFYYYSSILEKNNYLAIVVKLLIHLKKLICIVIKINSKESARWFCGQRRLPKDMSTFLPVYIMQGKYDSLKLSSDLNINVPACTFVCMHISTHTYT